MRGFAKVGPPFMGALNRGVPIVRLITYVGSRSGASILIVHGSPHIHSKVRIPKGPRTQIIGFQGPNTMNNIVTLL